MIRIALLLALASSVMPAQVRNQTCRSIIARDMQNVAAELTRLSLQAQAQSFPQAIAQFRADLQNLRQGLAPATRQALEAYSATLQSARSTLGPGGFASTPAERRQMTQAFTNLMFHKSLTREQRNYILRDMANVAGSLQGISPIPYQNAVTQLRNDLATCR